MKRIALLYILQSVFSIAAVAQVFHPDSLRYRIMDDGTAEVIGCAAREGIAIVPEKVTMDGKEYTVTRIGDGAFALPERLYDEIDGYEYDGQSYSRNHGWGFAAVYLPETVTAIGDEAFMNCSRTTFVRMPDKVASIGNRAFEGCISLGHIDLPQTLQTLGHRALNVANNDIGSSTSGIYSIGTDALPNLTSVGIASLAGNSNLQHFPLTDKVTELGASAFSGCRSLQSVHLPQGLTEIPDGLLSGCEGITSVELPNGISRIGNSAFSGTNISQILLPQGVNFIGNSAFAATPLSSINLSSYTGEIGELAFNNCYNLSTIYVSPMNRNCYTSPDGKSMFRGGSRELLTVLPSVEHLTIQYPATGKCASAVTIRTYKDSKEWSGTVLQYSDLSNLKSLELPCTWDAHLVNVVVPQLKDLVVRRAEPFPMQIVMGGERMQQQDSLDVQVFDYSMEKFQNARNLYGGSDPYFDQWTVGRNSTSLVRYAAIDRPTEELYLQEVGPMYPGMQQLKNNRLYSWSADWNAKLQDKHPEYFALIDTLDAKSEPAARSYREHHVNQYMTSERYDYYKMHEDTIVHCIDGELYRSTDFDENDYVNWYLSSDTIYGGTLYDGPDNRGWELATYGTITRIDTDPSQGVPGNAYWLMDPPSATGSPKFYYALRMVPSLTYDIYALMAPRLSWCETVQVEDSTSDYGYRDSLVVHDQLMAVVTDKNSEQYGDTIPAMSMIQATLYYSGLNNSGNPSSLSLNSEKLPVTYNGEVQPILLYDSITVERDYCNYIMISGSATSTQRRNGYVGNLAIVGIVAKAREEVPVLPTGVDEATVVTERRPVAYYDLQGRRHSQPVRGVNIVRYSDGSVAKFRK